MLELEQKLVDAKNCLAFLIECTNLSPADIRLNNSVFQWYARMADIFEEHRKIIKEKIEQFQAGLKVCNNSILETFVLLKYFKWITYNIIINVKGKGRPSDNLFYITFKNEAEFIVLNRHILVYVSILSLTNFNFSVLYCLYYAWLIQSKPHLIFLLSPDEDSCTALSVTVMKVISMKPWNPWSYIHLSMCLTLTMWLVPLKPIEVWQIQFKTEHWVHLHVCLSAQ